MKRRVHMLVCVIPRCQHGRIILGCPDDDCPEQNDYLAKQNAAVDAMYERQRDDARAYVRELLGLPLDDSTEARP